MRLFSYGRRCIPFYLHVFGLGTFPRGSRYFITKDSGPKAHVRYGHSAVCPNKVFGPSGLVHRA